MTAWVIKITYYCQATIKHIYNGCNYNISTILIREHVEDGGKLVDARFYTKKCRLEKIDNWKKEEYFCVICNCT